MDGRIESHFKPLMSKNVDELAKNTRSSTESPTKESISGLAKSLLSGQNRTEGTLSFTSIVLKPEPGFLSDKSPLLIQKLTGAGSPEVDLKTYESTYPLHAAASKGGETTLRKALRGHKERLEQRDDIGRTPLHCACQSGNKDALKMLLENKIDLNAPDAMGMTPLDHACAKGHPQLVKMLLKAGAEYSSIGYAMTYPAHAALLEGDLEKVRSLLTSGSMDINATDHQGRTLLHLACSGTSHDLFGEPRWFSSSVPIKTSLDAIKELIAAGAEVDIRDGRGATPLFYASYANDVACVKELMEGGADPGACPAEGVLKGIAPWHLACHGGSSELMRVFIDSGVVNSKLFSFGFTPYFFALSNPALNGTPELQILREMDRGKSDEVAFRKLLGHRFGLSGSSKLDGEKLEYEGWGGVLAWQQLVLSTERYYSALREGFQDPENSSWAAVLKQLSDADRALLTGPEAKLSHEDLKQVLTDAEEAIKTCVVFDKGAVPEGLADRVREGKVVALLTGWPGHYVGAVLDQQSICRCNKGEGSGRYPGIRYNPLQPEKLEDAIRLLGQMRSDVDFYENLEEQLGLKRTEESHFPQKKQKVGNCSVANSNSIELAVLYRLLASRLGDDQAAFRIATAIKKARCSDSRTGSMEEYLNYHSGGTHRNYDPDYDLIKRLYQKKSKNPAADKERQTVIEAWAKRVDMPKDWQKEVGIVNP